MRGSRWVPCISIGDIKNCTHLSARGELLKLLESGVFADLQRLIAPAGLKPGGTSGVRPIRLRLLTRRTSLALICTNFTLISKADPSQ